MGELRHEEALKGHIRVCANILIDSIRHFSPKSGGIIDAVRAVRRPVDGHGRRFDGTWTGTAYTSHMADYGVFSGPVDPSTAVFDGHGRQKRSRRARRNGSATRRTEPVEPARRARRTALDAVLTQPPKTSVTAGSGAMEAAQVTVHQLRPLVVGGVETVVIPVVPERSEYDESTRKSNHASQGGLSIANNGAVSRVTGVSVELPQPFITPKRVKEAQKSSILTENSVTPPVELIEIIQYTKAMLRIKAGKYYTGYRQVFPHWSSTHHFHRFNPHSQHTVG
ncbi:hypothetical protein C8J57DRAFT_1236822 [Mycena rebaudengoi]|nr:hypothetical protein C8J57DRAFT_1236822 [Mycena rebaudengoi]